ncbi:hypothetical protein QPK87_15605 [Kamptonema cortianum]|nr:hypothetical protein [Kamptonema cortianum]
MWLSFKNWIRRPLIITGLVCLLISAVAQKKDYWKHWNIPAAFQNLSLILKESRPLELVLTDRDPDAKPMVLRALATAPGQTVKVEESYQNPHLRFFSERAARRKSASHRVHAPGIHHADQGKI